MTSRDQEALRDILGVMDRALGFPIADFDAFRSQPLPNRRRNPWESPPNTYGIPRPVGWLHHGQMQAPSGRGH